MWKKTICFVLICIVFGIISVYIGYTGIKLNKYEVVRDKDVDLKENIDTVETSFSQEKVNLNTKIIVNTLYKKCNHTILEKINIEEGLINKEESEIKDYFENKGYDFLEFDNNVIKLEYDNDGLCTEHYVIKFGNYNDDFLAIYRVDENSELNLYKETDIAKEFLTKVDNEKLEKGIEVYGIENIEKILEDYE